MHFVKCKCKCLWGCPNLKSFPQSFENENVYINEIYLINEFYKRLRPGVPGVSAQIRQMGWIEPGGRYTFSPVVRLNSIRVIISFAIFFKWPLFQLDVKKAFFVW